MSAVRTKHGLNPYECASYLQKSIRRGLERDALTAALEMAMESKALCSWACGTLEVASHEDVETIDNPTLVPFVATACEQARRYWKKDNIGRTRLFLASAIRALCRAPKSRQNDHFAGAVGLPLESGEASCEIPDWAFDKHTIPGKRGGRGVWFSEQEGTKLVNAVDEDDPYRDEFWAEYYKACDEPRPQSLPFMEE